MHPSDGASASMALSKRSMRRSAWIASYRCSAAEAKRW